MRRYERPPRRSLPTWVVVLLYLTLAIILAIVILYSGGGML